MRIPIMVSIAAFFLSLNVQARIGESYDQCVKRYGSPIVIENNLKLLDQRTGLEIKQFKKEGVLVKAIFSNDKAVYIEYNYNTLKLETGEKSSEIIKKLLELNGKDWTADKTSIDRNWLLEYDEGVIAGDRVEPGVAKDRWICSGGPEKGGLIAVKAILWGALIIVNADYMELVMKNQPKFQKERSDKVKKALENF